MISSRGVAQSGSASGLGPEGRGFESLRPDQPLPSEERILAPMSTDASDPHNEPIWWRTGVIYQVYPRSFMDASGDGIGDLAGILSRLDYLVTLGITAVWVSPIYPSPMADFGYDVADYTGIAPVFGTMQDFDRLLAGCHTRGLKLILDFVPNHTSDQHPWFLESRSSRDNPKRDWYLWQDAQPGGEVPNNWMSNFGGTAWTWDEKTAQYYYHSFLPQQPDLNWRNPAVHHAMFAAMRFWLDKGVDGFRMDVLWLLIKDDRFRDNPPNPEPGDGNSFHSVLPKYTADQPETHVIVRQMRELLDSYPGHRVLIGEIYLPIKELVRYYGAEEQTGGQGTVHLLGAQMPFNFHLILTAWQPEAVAELIRQYEASLPAGAWPNWVMGNHDQHRIATRIGLRQARVAAMLLLTLRGTPTLYYGDELGMTDAVIPPDQVQDPAEKRQPGLGLGRDPERSPMLWNQDPNAGFCPPAVKPWLPLIEDFAAHTVAAESDDPCSTLSLYRQLLRLRSAEDALHAGTVEQVEAFDGVLRYRRRGTGASMQILLNMTAEPKRSSIAPGRIVLRSGLQGAGEQVAGEFLLQANEGVLLRLD